MAASAAASASSLRFAESRRVAARGDAFSHFPGPRMQKGSEWRPVGGALTSSGTVHVRSVAVLRQTHPGGTFGPPRRLFGDENASSKKKGARSETRARDAPRRDTAPASRATTRFREKVPAGSWTRASPTTSTSPRRAPRRRRGSRRRRRARRRGFAGPRRARLPARLRPREDAPTAEDVDKAVKRFVKIFAENGAAVRLTRQAPFKYVLEQAGVPARDASGAFGARAARKMLMLKLERSRLVVHRGGASRGGGRRRRERAGGGPGGGNRGLRRARAPAPCRRRASFLDDVFVGVDVARRGGGARARPGEGQGVAGERATLRGGATPTSATLARRAVCRVRHDVHARAGRADADAAANETDARRNRRGSRRRRVVRVVRRAAEAGEGVRKRSPQRVRWRSMRRRLTGRSRRVRGTFRRDDAPGASPVRAGAPAPTRAEEQKAKPKPALPPPPEEQKRSPAPVAPKPAPADARPAARPRRREKPVVRRRAGAAPRPKVTAPAADDDWDLP